MHCYQCAIVSSSVLTRADKALVDDLTVHLKSPGTHGNLKLLVGSMLVNCIIGVQLLWSTTSDKCKL